MIVLRLVLADLAADRIRSIVAVAAIVPIVVAHLVLVSVADALADAPAGAGRSLVLLSTNPLDPSTGRLDDAIVADAVDAAGGAVTAVTPLIFRPVKVGESIFQLRAAPADAWDAELGLTLLAGRFPEPRADEIVVTEGVAAASGWRTGEIVEIFSSRFTIVGLVRAPGTKFASIWMLLERADLLFEADGTFQMASLEIDPAADPESVRQVVAEAAVGRYSAYFEDELTELQGAGLRAASDLSVLGTVIGIAVLAFGAFNLTAIALAERSPDLGIARVLGVRRVPLVAFVAVRSAVLALVGYVVGAIGAFAYIAGRGSTTLRSFVLTPHLDAGDLVRGLVITAGATLVGSWLAAWRAGSRPARELVEPS